MQSTLEQFTSPEEERLAKSFSLGVGLFAVALCLIAIAVGLSFSPDALTSDGKYKLRTFWLLFGGVPLALGVLHSPIAIYMYRRNMARLQHFRSLRASSHLGIARLVRIEHLRGNEEDVTVLLSLTVSVPGLSPYDLTQKQDVKISYTSRLRPGELIPIRVALSEPAVLLSTGRALSTAPRL